MKFLSIDTETTGLDRGNHQVLEIGLVGFDTEQPFHFNNLFLGSILVDVKELHGSPFAINLNKDIIQEIISLQSKEPVFKDPYHLDTDALIRRIFSPKENVMGWLNKFINEFLGESEIAYPCGRNVTFDLDIIKSNFGEHPLLKESQSRTRLYDPTVDYIDPNKDKFGGLEYCKEVSGLFPYKDVLHRAIFDAFDVAILAYQKYGKATTLSKEYVGDMYDRLIEEFPMFNSITEFGVLSGKY